jgi:hypothetical protein
MKELDEYREKLLKRLGDAAVEFRLACLAVKDVSKPVDAGWNVHQLAVHTRDVDRLVYGERARRTLHEDHPAFTNFDGDAYMAEHYDPKESLPGVLDGLVTSVDSLVKALREMSPDGWSRESTHEIQGAGLTVQTWVERGLHHIEEHMETVKKA